MKKPDRGDGPAGQPRVNWDHSDMRSVHADVCQITGAQDEIVLLFGSNRTRHEGGEMKSIQLEDRVVMTPLAAKRFYLLLSDALKEYEGKYGAIEN